MKTTSIAMNVFGVASTVGLAALLVSMGQGCGGPPMPPVELTNARAELVRAKNGPANQLDPADVHDASLALDKAERAWTDNGDDPASLDLARVAQLKAQSAEAKASALQAEMDRAQAEQAFKDSQAAKLQATQGALATSQSDLNNEKVQRVKAEEQLKSARLTLAQIASVKDDDRGMVVTFQGEALFKTGKSELLAGAMVKLDRVAETLKGQERHMMVVGYTDNVGGNTNYNQELSEKRANAVKTYLVSHGVPQDLIGSEGRGPTQPVGDNATVEGRAMNRRVEIIVQPPAPSTTHP